jgi:sulfite reductase (NADPH) hemoprotein beta-component
LYRHDRLANRDRLLRCNRITTRQTIQLHGIIKSNLKATMACIDAVLLTTIAACGDVNRNVICNSNPNQSRVHAAALATACSLSDHLLPRTPAYREIWLDGEKIAGGEDEVIEPIYGATYLPRKFKIAVAVPPSNDVDVFAHDLAWCCRHRAGRSRRARDIATASARRRECAHGP